MPSDALLDRIYSPGYLNDHYSAELTGETTSGEFARESVEAASLAAGAKPRGTLLDIGCGAGQFLVAAREQGLRVEGHERMATTAKIASAASGVTVHAGELGSLVGRYDVVHLADVLEHSPVPAELLRSAASLLGSDGVVLARGPLQNNRTVFNWALQWSRTARRALGPLPKLDAAPLHLVLFTYAGWRELIDRCGMEVVDERVYELHWPAPERLTPSFKSITKEISLRLTRTRIGRHLKMGDRVVTVLRPRRGVSSPPLPSHPA